MSSDELDELPIVYTLIENRRKRERAIAEEQQTEEEKSKLLHAKRMSKIWKPSECMKYIDVELHPELAKLWYAVDIASEVSAAGANIVMARDIIDPFLVMWSRRLPADILLQRESTKERCDHALYISIGEEIAELVSAMSLGTRMSDLKAMVGCKLTIVIFAAKDYLKNFNIRSASESGREITQIDVEMALTDLLVTAGIDTIFINTPNELAREIVQFTKAIALAPYKKAKHAVEDPIEFYMKGHNKKSVVIDEQGNGVENLWQQMIATLPLSSLEIARAFCSKYRTPKEFMETLSQTEVGPGHTADILVPRSGAPGSKHRHIGPEFARKLHKLFSSQVGKDIVG